MSIKSHREHEKGDGASYRDSLNFVVSRESSAAALAAEYVARSQRLELFQRLVRAHAAEPQSLALELARSVLYDDKALQSIHSHADAKPGDDSLWNGKPQHYFESMKYSENESPSVEPEFECDSLAQ